eukprot:scaffold37766_cov20-Prasinocladus_malaysianus.AAC.1
MSVVISRLQLITTPYAVETTTCLIIRNGMTCLRAELHGCMSQSNCNQAVSPPEKVYSSLHIASHMTMRPDEGTQDAGGGKPPGDRSGPACIREFKAYLSL